MPEMGTSLGLSPGAGAFRGAAEPQSGRPRPAAPEAERAGGPVPPLGAGVLSDTLEIQGGIRPAESGGEAGFEIPESPGRSRELVFNDDFGAFQNAISVGDEEIARLPPDSLLKARQAVGRFVQDHFTASPNEQAGDLLGGQVDEEA